MWAAWSSSRCLSSYLSAVHHAHDTSCHTHSPTALLNKHLYTVTWYQKHIAIVQAVVTLDPSAMAPGKDAALTGTASVGSRFSINTYAVSGLLCQVYYSHDDKETWALLTTLFGSAGHTQGNEVALEFGLYNTDAKSLRSVMWALQNGDQQAFLQNDCEVVSFFNSSPFYLDSLIPFYIIQCCLTCVIPSCVDGCGC